MSIIKHQLVDGGFEEESGSNQEESGMNFFNLRGAWVWLLPLLWVAGRMRGNGKCQKRGREFSQLRWGGDIVRIVIRQPYPLSHVILLSLVPS